MARICCVIKHIFSFFEQQVNATLIDPEPILTTPETIHIAQVVIGAGAIRAEMVLIKSALRFLQPSYTRLHFHIITDESTLVSLLAFFTTYRPHGINMTFYDAKAIDVREPSVFAPYFLVVFLCTHKSTYV